MQLKIIDYQIMKLLDEVGQRALEIESDLYNWSSVNGRETDHNGALLVASVLS